MQTNDSNEDRYYGKTRISDSSNVFQNGKENRNGKRTDSRSSTPVSRENSFQKNRPTHNGRVGQGFSSDSRKKGKTQQPHAEVDFSNNYESYKKVKPSGESSAQNSPVITRVSSTESNSANTLDNKISAWHSLAPSDENGHRSVGSGQLHRRGKNYKPVGERRIIVQKETRNANRKKPTSQRTGTGYSTKSSTPGFVWQEEPNKSVQKAPIPSKAKNYIDTQKVDVSTEEASKATELKQRDLAVPKSKGGKTSSIASTSKLRVDCPEFKPSLNFDFSKLNFNSNKTATETVKYNLSASGEIDQNKEPRIEGKRSRSDTGSSTPSQDLSHISNDITTPSSTATTPKLSGFNLSSRWNLNAPAFVPKSAFSFVPSTPPTIESKIPTATATSTSNDYTMTGKKDEDFKYQNPSVFQYPEQTEYQFEPTFHAQPEAYDRHLYTASEFTYLTSNYQGLNELDYPANQVEEFHYTANEASNDTEFIYDRGFEGEAVYPTPEEEYVYPSDKNDFQYSHQYEASHYLPAEVEVKPLSQTIFKFSKPESKKETSNIEPKPASSRVNGSPSQTNSRSGNRDEVSTDNSGGLKNQEIKESESLVVGVELKDGSIQPIEIYPNDDLESKARQFCTLWDISGRKIVQRLASRLAQERENHPLRIS
ncbi:hypothetical protein K7432_002608 [Basidiobolus ranarum]|uniref:Uncharacterized protein n=1 Tax=Basidiobolus ranarum TaxID=34480 RepID=A0ABR2W7H6_9FUNG